MFCPECGTENPDHYKFCPECGADLRAVRAGGKVSVDGDVGPGGVAGSGKVDADNIAGRDVIGELHQYYGVSSDVELEDALRMRLFTTGVHKNRDDV